MLAHLAGQMSQNLMPFRYPDFEGSVSGAFYDGPVNGDHVFFWNGITSFYVKPRPLTWAARKLSLTEQLYLSPTATIRGATS